MIELSAEHRNGRLSLAIRGHAAPKHAEGYEVCIATSVLAQGLAKAVREMAPEAVIDYRKAKGDMTLSIRYADDDTVCGTVIRGFLTAMKDLARENPAYLRYNDSED